VPELTRRFVAELSDFHRFNLQKLHWADLTGKLGGSSPTERAGHGFTSDGQSLFVFGGWNGTGAPSC
jgi:hypothetical protein